MSKDLDQIFAISAVPLDGEWIQVEFSDGAIHDIGVRDLLSRGGVSSGFGKIADSSSR
jgi:hypothetical protein